MDDRRRVFLAGAGLVADWLGRSEVAQRWHEPSALAGMRIAGLAGHLSRAVTLVETVLDDEPASDGEDDDIDAVAYFLALPDLTDPDSARNADIRARGEETAAVGPTALAATLAESLRRLDVRLVVEPDDRRISRGGVAMRLDDYLATRIVEVAVHLDDLAASLGFVEGDIPPETIDMANETLFRVAVGRIGPSATLRALARRERSSRALLAF